MRIQQMKTMADQYSAINSDEVQSKGGPREGKGGAVAEAIRAAAIGCRAWAKGEGLIKGFAASATGIPTVMHKAQSMVWTVDSALSASSEDTIFIVPPVVQTRSMAFGATRGEAMATLTDMTNHASTKRTMVLAHLMLST